MERAFIHKIIPFSSVDGPGNRTVIFLQGCNFHCKYCHNPETMAFCNHCGACVDTCPVGALHWKEDRVAFASDRCVQCDTCIHVCPRCASPRVQEMTVEQVLSLVERNRPYIRGLTVSGGECTYEKLSFLQQLLTAAKEKGLHTLLDSNGSCDFSQYPDLLSLTDGVMLDVKAWNAAEHKALTGCDNITVLKNLTYLASVQKLTEVRTVVVPELMNAPETVRCVSETLVQNDAPEVLYKLISFRPIGVRQEYQLLRPPVPTCMQQLQELAYAQGMKHVIVV